MNKAQWKKRSFKWHHKLAWISLFALILFVVSAATHPLLSWTGPRAAKFNPPSMHLESYELNAIGAILKNHGIKLAEIIKVVPSEHGNMLQVTEDRSKPRRYFDLKDGQERINFDKQHALWLANYYLGYDAKNSKHHLPVKEITFVTEFDSTYPWVNRLLPVYRVQFADDDNTSTYIYTELNALAGMGNDYKTQMQAVFRNLHTWSWLNRYKYTRIIIIGLLLASVVLMVLAGIGLLLLLKKRPNTGKKNRVHRALAYIIAVPLLGFCVSGFYHLLHYGLAETHRGMIAGEPINLTNLNTHTQFQGVPNKPLNHLSLINHINTLHFRLSLSNEASSTHSDDTLKIDTGEHAHHSNSITERTKHFDGKPMERGGLYFSAETGLKTELTDHDVALQLASRHINVPASSSNNVKLITHFGPHYDFRNKRLPVWQVDFDTNLGDKVFIDPATGIMVDRLVNQDRYESYSFSFLHKWNLLTPFIGRFWRDVIIVIVLCLTLIVSLLGLAMKVRHR